MKAISLFSGCGGDTKGLHDAGVEVVAYSEFDKTCRETHEHNFEHCTLLGKDVGSDITKITDQEFKSFRGKADIVFAGFPCQSFSSGGKRKVNDPRDTLFMEFVRCVRLVKPKIIIGENVKGILTKKTEKGLLFLDIIMDEFRKLGYNLKHKVCRCDRYGVPQKRERFIMLGVHKNNTDECRLEFPPQDDGKAPNLLDIIKFNMEGAMSIPKEIVDNLDIPRRCIVKDMKSRKGENNPHPYMLRKRDIESKEYKGKTYPHLFSFGKRISPIHVEIVDIRSPCKTIICTYDHQPRLLVLQQNKKGYFVRTMSPDELKQIQGFPLDYVLCGDKKKQIKQIGNAVPPRLVERIVRHMLTG